MAYVDLNPIRACMAGTPEDSDYTSIKERIEPTFDLAQTIQEQTAQQFLKQFALPLKPLTQFERSSKNEPRHGIMFHHQDYLELVDFTGRAINPQKRGHIPERQPPILHRLGIDADEWLTKATKFEARYLNNRRAHLNRRRSTA